MKLLNLFGCRKRMTIKELYAPVIDQMWCCVVNFCPWSPDKHGVIFKKVNIVKAIADRDGIWVESDSQNPFEKYCKNILRGYIDKITMTSNTTGFFETEEAAKAAYNKLMEDCIAVIKNKMCKPEEYKKD